MSFNTLDFFLFFFILLFFYYCAPSRLKNFILLAASYCFYAAYDIKLTLFLVFSTVFNYIAALLITNKHPKFFLTLGILIDLLILG